MSNACTTRSTPILSVASECQTSTLKADGKRVKLKAGRKILYKIDTLQPNPFCDCGVSQNAAHLLECKMVEDGKSRTWEESRDLDRPAVVRNGSRFHMLKFILILILPSRGNWTELEETESEKTSVIALSHVCDILGKELGGVQASYHSDGGRPKQLIEQSVPLVG